MNFKNFNVKDSLQYPIRCLIAHGIENLAADDLTILFAIGSMIVKEVVEDKAVKVDKREVFCIGFPGIGNIERQEIAKKRVYIIYHVLESVVGMEDDNRRVGLLG